MAARRWTGFIVFLLLFSSLAAAAEREGGRRGRFLNFLLGLDAPTFRPAPPDPRAASCLGCHDGSRAKSVVIRFSGESRKVSDSDRMDHPIGMIYGDSAREDSMGLTPAALLDRSILLVEGRVSCVSCHQLKPTFGAQPLGAGGDAACEVSGRLTVAPRDLCRACHQDK